MAITITAPAAGLLIGRDEDVQLFVTADAPALKRAVITFEFPGLGVSEQVHDGTSFRPPYQHSLRTSYTAGMQNGFQFIVRRDHGWQDGPVVHVVAYDTAGGEAIL